MPIDLSAEKNNPLAFPPVIKSPIPLHPYQEQAKDFVKTHPFCGVFFDMGLGKTAITLSAILESCRPGNVLVVAPKNIARSTWMDEIRKWSVPLRAQSLIVNDKFRDISRKVRMDLYAKIPEMPPAVYFINRELLPDLINNMPVINGRPTWFFPNLVLDESQGFKNYKSQRFKALRTVMPAVSSCIELSGTPTPEDLMDLWSQIYILDGGARLGRTITQYRNRFFRPTLYMNGYPVKFEPLPGAEEEIYALISDIVISAKNTNLKLPPVTYNDFRVYLDDAEKKVYNRFLKDAVLQFADGSQAIAVNSGVLHNKLCQMAAGTVYVNDEHHYKIIHGRKVEAVRSILSQSSGPVIIAYYFKSDLEILLESIQGAVRFDGSHQMIEDWNARKIPVMLLHPGSAGHGLNLQQGGHTLIWYSLQANLEQYLQTNARIYRQGQKDPVVIHHIVADGTIDPATVMRLKDKDASQERLLEAVRVALDGLD